MKQAPENWIRQSLCTDFFHQPEIVPLEALRGNDERSLTFNSLIRMLRDDISIAHKLFGLLFASPLIIIGFLPSLTYRITFKATSIAYLPFIWVIRETLSSDLPVKERLKRFKDSEIEKTRRVISWAVFATLIGKLGFVYDLVGQKIIEEKFPSKKIVENIVIPAGWPWWQITLGIEAALTFFLFYFADAAIARIEANQVWSEEFALKTVSTTSFLRAILSLVAISYFFYVALKIAAPGFVSQLFGT